MSVLRIVYVLPPGPLADEARVAIGQASGLARRGHAVTVLADGEPPAGADLAARWLPERRSAALADAEVVVAIGWEAAREAKGRRLSGPLVHQIPFYELDACVDPARREAAREAYALPTSKLVDSELTRSLVQEAFRTRAWVVPPSVDARLLAERRAGHGETARRVLVVDPADVDPPYVDALVRALRRGGIDVGIEIVRAARLDAETDAALVVSAAQAAHRRVPRVVLDAMALSIPAILSDVPGHHEFAAGGDHARFVPPDDVGAIAENALEILRNPHVAKRLSLAGRMVARGFSEKAALDRLERALFEIEEKTPVLRVVTASSCGVSRPDTNGVLRDSRYRFAAQLVKGLRVLDVGCGDGSGTALLAAAGGSSVEGLDASEIAVRAALRDHAADNLSFRVDSAHRLPAAASSVDLVVAFDCLERLDDPARFCREARRVLTPQGALLLSVDGAASPAPGGDLDGDPGLRFDEDHRRTNVQAMLERFFHRVTVFAQTIESGHVIVRPGHAVSGRELAFLFLASQQQRLPAPSPIIDATKAVHRKKRRAA